jgi:hypothetical protein
VSDNVSNRFSMRGGFRETRCRRYEQLARAEAASSSGQNARHRWRPAMKRGLAASAGLAMFGVLSVAHPSAQDRHVQVRLCTVC